MTFLQLVNRVLQKLREDPITAVPTTGYPALVAQMVNEAKEDIEDMGDWYPLRTTVNSATVADTATVDLTAYANERSYLLYSKNQPQAFLIQSGFERRLAVLEQGETDTLRAIVPDADTGTPYAVSFSKSADGLTAEFVPVPDAVYSVRFVFVVPQAELAADATAISIPARPVWLEATVRAMEERGEEFAGPIDAARARAMRALDAAIMTDFGRDERTAEAD